MEAQPKGNSASTYSGEIFLFLDARTNCEQNRRRIVAKKKKSVPPFCTLRGVLNYTFLRYGKLRSVPLGMVGMMIAGWRRAACGRRIAAK
jgi:hypothetical protein